MKTLRCVVTVASFLFVAACNASSGAAGTSPSEKIPMGPEPGSPAAQSQTGGSGAGSTSAGMPGAY